MRHNFQDFSLEIFCDVFPSTFLTCPVCLFPMTKVPFYIVEQNIYITLIKISDNIINIIQENAYVVV